MYFCFPFKPGPVCTSWICQLVYRNNPARTVVPVKQRSDLNSSPLAYPISRLFAAHYQWFCAANDPIYG